MADCDAVSGASLPDWIVEGGARAVSVVVTAAVADCVATLIDRCKLYRDARSLLQAVQEVLAVNIRSAFQQGGTAARDLGKAAVSLMRTSLLCVERAFLFPVR